MPKTITLYRTWDGEDMALSDTFHESKKTAVEHLKTTYEVRPKELKELLTTGETVITRIINPYGEDVEDTTYVYLRPVEIEMTKAGVAHALTFLPNR